MEDEAIREGFTHLRPGWEYDGLHQDTLCRSKADWLVGINATRLFSPFDGCTLNIGRVVSPTLALVVQREAEIAAFQSEPFYTVELDCAIQGQHQFYAHALNGKKAGLVPCASILAESAPRFHPSWCGSLISHDVLCSFPKISRLEVHF